MKAGVLAVLAALAAGCTSVASDGIVGGTRPAYLESVTEEVPNAAALGRRIWTPGLDAGYVPQGLTSAGPYLLVSSYLPTPDLRANTGPCRVFRIEAATGKDAGHFDLPPGECTHAGGLAYLGGGRLLLADTHRLFLIDLERALASGKAEEAMKSVYIEGRLRGSFATFDGHDIWIGTWTKDAGQARMFRLDPRLFDEFDGRTIGDDRALESFAIPAEAQGAAWDRHGGLWLSASNGAWGRLYRLDRHGAVQARYEMVASLEDLAVDDAGQIWGLSESGTRKYIHQATRFPFIFRIDVAKLR